jgi:hypothetical protein
MPCLEVVRQKTGFASNVQDEPDPSWWDEVFSKNGVSDRMDEDSFVHLGLSKEEVAGHARPLWELECLVNAMDCVETTAAIAEAHRQ